MQLGERILRLHQNGGTFETLLLTHAAKIHQGTYLRKCLLAIEEEGELGLDESPCHDEVVQLRIPGMDHRRLHQIVALGNLACFDDLESTDSAQIY